MKNKITQTIMITHLILQPMTARYVFRRWNKANGPLIKQHEIYICVTGSSTYTSVCHALQTRHDLGGPRLSSDIPSIFTTATVSLPSYLITPAAHSVKMTITGVVEQGS